MHTSRTLTSIILLLLCSIFVSAYPQTDVQERGIAKRYVTDKLSPGDDKVANKYPNDDKIKEDFKDPGKDKYVFYSGVGDKADAPTRFAASIGGKMLSQCFEDPKYLAYAGRGKAWHANFVDRVSGIFADNAHGEVFFLRDFEKEPDDCRVWKRVELASLQQNTKVSKITEVNYKDFNDRRSVSLIELIDSIRKSNDQKYCYDWEGYGEDPSLPNADNDPYRPGWCTFHVVQWQKNEGPGSDTSKYRYDLTLFDSQGEEIGSMDKQPIADKDTFKLKSRLPKTLDITSGSVDSDAIAFAYDGQTWDVYKDQCKIKKSYDDGKREGDCGFTCK